MNDLVLAALREIRALELGDRALAPRMLEIIRAATASHAVTLRHPLLHEELRVGAAGNPDLVRVERSFRLRAGAGVLVLELARARADDANVTLELLGGEVVLRLDQARVEAEASRLRRQVDLFRALSRAGEEALRLQDAAERTVRELRDAFTVTNVIVHVLVEDHLELIARHVEAGSGVANAPDWIRALPVDDSTVMGRAARDKCVVTRAVRDLPPQRRDYLEKAGVRHLIVMPLLFHDAVFGTLTVGHQGEESWDAESMRLLEEAAAQLGVELAHVRLLDAERRRAEDLGLINELGALVSQHLEVGAVLSTAARALARMTQVPRVHAFLANEDATILSGVACTDDQESTLVLPIDSSAAVSHAFRTREPVSVEDASIDPRVHVELVARIGTRSLLAVPLVSRGKSIGAIVLVETRRTRRFTASEIERVVSVANLVATAVANAKMYDDLRRSYDALERAQAELVTHERLAALGELSAVIAHEVRNPIAIIFNSLGAIRRLERPTADASMLLDIVDEEARRLDRIVRDLLDFVRPYFVRPSQVQVRSIVKNAVDAARRAAGDASVEIRTELSLPSEDVFLDGVMLQQALLNLIANAVQATPAGRIVTVRASEADAKLRCEVADEGPGIDVANTDRIFQPFFTTKATGTGLGLAIVRRLAGALGGSVEGVTRPSGGSLFTLTVPLVTARADG